MSLLQSLKNVFFDEECIEIEEKTIVKKSPPIARKIEFPKQEEISEIETKEEKEEETFNDNELLKSDFSFKMFDDEDFSIDSKIIDEIVEEKIEKPVTNLYKGDYKNLLEEKELKKEEVKRFKPTPVISPIYGILDKNYTSDDIVEKKGEYSFSKNPNKIDLDTVRKKAYGDLFYDLDLSGEDNYKKEDTYEIEDEIEDSLLYDMSDVETKPAVAAVTMADAEEYFNDLGLEYNIDYKDKQYEKASGRRVRYNDELNKPNEKESIEDVEKSFKVEDNLFDLIDSMYEDKE